MTSTIAILAMSVVAFAISGERASAAGFGKNEMQLLWGPDAEFGSATPEGTDVLTLTINHFSTWKYGSNFLFVDFTQETNGTKESGYYGEFFPSLSLAKVTGADFSFGPILDIQPTAGINLSEAAGFYLMGVKLPLDLPGAANGSFQAYSYTTFRDPLDRDLDTTYQFTVTWRMPFTLGDDQWRFSFEGFADYIGSRGSGLTWRVVAQPQIRLDVGHFFGRNDRIIIGTELAFDRNKFGVRDVNEFVPKVLLVIKF